MWVPLISALLGGLLAVAGGLVTQWYIHWTTIRQQRRSLANALAGEIAALCSIIERRDYLNAAKILHQHIQETSQAHFLKLSANQEYFLVYKHNLGSIGLLPAPLAKSVATFYTQIQSLLEDATSPVEEDAPYIEALNILNDQIGLLEDSLKMGHDLSEKLTQIR